MVPVKILKIALKRCDAVAKSNIEPKQNCAPKVRKKNSPNFPAATIKVENEFVEDGIVSTHTAKGDSNKAIDDMLKCSPSHFGGSVRSSLSDPQASVQFPSNGSTGFDFSQTGVVVKTEREEENFSAVELVGCLVRGGPFKTEVDGREVVLQQSVEELPGNVSRFNSRVDFDPFSFPQTTSCIKAEEAVEEERAVKQELVSFTVADDVRRMAANDEGTAAENLNVLPKLRNGIKTERVKAEEGQITSELVGRLPNGLEDSEGGSITQFPEKILKILLKRCDAVTSESKQNQASKVRNKDSPNFPAAMIKVENQFVGNEIVLTQKAVKNAESAICATDKPQLDFHHLSVMKGHNAKKGTPKKNQRKVMRARNSKTSLTLCSVERCFECFHCGARLKTKKTLASHIRCMHSENLYISADCSANFRTKRLTASHVNTRISYACPHCSKIFTRKQYLEQHLKCTGEVQCPLQHCLLKFSHRCLLRAHQRSVHAVEKRYTCDRCPAQFSQKGSLQNHLSVHSKERNHACSQCPAKFKGRDSLRGHLKTHETERRHDCALCSYHCKVKNTLRHHLNVVHFGVEKSFACDQCSARFYRKDTLKEHLLIHSTEKSFACDQCPAKFITASKLKRHAAVHSTERPFKCKTCPKSFKSHRTLQRHAKIHSGVNLHACDQCPAKFVAPFLLRDHKEGHSNTIICEICSKTCKTRKALQLHLKNGHSRPYFCPHCPLMCLSRSQLRTHSKVHVGERRFACAHCPSKFKYRDDLIRHFVVHAKKKRFVCAHCAAKFARRGDLIAHLRRHHIESSVASLPK